MARRQLKPKKTSDQVALVSHDITIELKTLKKLNMLERKKLQILTQIKYKPSTQKTNTRTATSQVFRKLNESQNLNKIVKLKVSFTGTIKTKQGSNITKIAGNNTMTTELVTTHLLNKKLTLLFVCIISHTCNQYAQFCMNTGNKLVHLCAGRRMSDFFYPLEMKEPSNPHHNFKESTVIETSTKKDPN